MPIVPIQIYSFFAGVGFLDLGFQNANFDIAFVNEYNIFAMYRGSRLEILRVLLWAKND